MTKDTCVGVLRMGRFLIILSYQAILLFYKVVTLEVNDGELSRFKEIPAFVVTDQACWWPKNVIKSSL